MINRYPGTCTRCQGHVPAMAGQAVRDASGRWTVTHVTPCPAVPAIAPVKPVAASIGNVAGILALFDRALARNVSSPAIELRVPDALTTVRLSVAGERAKVPGSLTVTYAARGFDRSNWLGRILRDGTFEPSRNCPPQIAPRLVAFAANPAKIAADHARLTRRCCFCNLQLWDERSVSVGYGETCADNFGLPWGKRSVAPTVQATPAPTAPDDFDGTDDYQDRARREEARATRNDDTSTKNAGPYRQQSFLDF